jgi:hypothetical protein
MSNLTCFSSLLRRTLAVGAVLGAGVAVMHAQTPAASTSSATTLNLSAPVAAESYSSSSSTNDTTQMASVASHLDFLGAMNAMQYGGRRTGRPRYRGGNQNADGSNKFEFYAGVGATAPVGDTHKYYTPDWGIQVGAGRNFNSHFGVNVEFNWDNLNLQGNTINNQQNLYNYYYQVYCTNNPGDQLCSGGTPQISGLDAYSHIWSLSLQPVYKFPLGESLGAYVTGGFGFYHKITTFTVAETGCDPYYLEEGYGCIEESANEPIDSYTSNAPGVDAGIGLTYKFSRFSNERFYVEARYVYTFNSPRAGVTYATASPSNIDVTNDFPANSDRTSYIPIKVGIRF